MGQAAAPNEPINEAASLLGNADDLLSQLAAEEIDRLLAENELESRPPAGASPQELSEVDLTALAKEASAENAAKLEEAKSSVRPDSPPAPAPAMEHSAASSSASAPQSDCATDSAERAALHGTACDDRTAVENDAADESLPVYLTPLAWLNAPLRSLPESVRDAIGKVAIITLVNAIAVLIYVMLFRR